MAKKVYLTEGKAEEDWSGEGGGLGNLKQDADIRDLLTSDSSDDDSSNSREVLDGMEGISMNLPPGEDISEGEGERVEEGAVRASAENDRPRRREGKR